MSFSLFVILWGSRPYISGLILPAGFQYNSLARMNTMEHKPRNKLWSRSPCSGGQISKLIWLATQRQKISQKFPHKGKFYSIWCLGFPHSVWEKGERSAISIISKFMLIFVKVWVKYKYFIRLLSWAPRCSQFLYNKEAAYEVKPGKRLSAVRKPILLWALD